MKKWFFPLSTRPNRWCQDWLQEDPCTQIWLQDLFFCLFYAYYWITLSQNSSYAPTIPIQESQKANSSKNIMVGMWTMKTRLTFPLNNLFIDFATLIFPWQSMVCFSQGSSLVHTIACCSWNFKILTRNNVLCLSNFTWN